MIIIEAAYQPSIQQIAFYVEETGECGEQRLHHCDGQAEKFYRDLEQTGVSVRMGMETTGYSRWFKRLLTEFGLRVWIGDAARMESRQGRYGAQTSHSALLDVTHGRRPTGVAAEPEPQKTGRDLCVPSFPNSGSIMRGQDGRWQTHSFRGYSVRESGGAMLSRYACQHPVTRLIEQN
jgi:hypothetical protein